MSDHVDDQDLSFAEGEGDGSALKKKVKGGGPIIVRILMYIGIGLGALLFIVTVVVFTVNYLNKQGKPMAAIIASEAYEQATPVYQYVTTLGEIRTRTVDREPSSIVVKVNLGFDANDKTTPTDVNQRLPQLRDFLRNYFSKKRADELSPDREQDLKAELRENINRILSKPALKEVLFEKFDVVKM